MANGVLQVDVEPRSYRHLISELNRLPKQTQEEIRLAAQDIAHMLKTELEKSAAHSPTPQARLVAKSILTPKDRLPKVTIGGEKKVGRAYTARGQDKKSKKKKRAPAGALMWGSEYGSRQGKDRSGRTYTNRYKAQHRAKGYWIAPALENALPRARDEYERIVRRVMDGAE